MSGREGAMGSAVDRRKERGNSPPLREAALQLGRSWVT